MRQAPEFERNLVHSGIHLIKFWFSVSREEQRRRFEEREAHPLKQWKLSPDRHGVARQVGRLHAGQGGDVLPHRHGRRAVDGDQVRRKKRARLNALRYLLHSLPYTAKDVERIGAVDPLLVGPRARRVRARREGRTAWLTAPRLSAARRGA